jgi:hypothetical protein
MVNLHEDRLKGQCKKDCTVEMSDRGGDELIGWKDKREFDGEIVFRKSGSRMNVSWAATQGKELQCATYLGIAKGRRFGFGEGAKFTGAGFDGAAWQMI